MTLLQALVEYCKSKNLVVEDGEDAFRDFLPDDPDDCVAFFEYGGDPPTPYDTILHRSVQVVVRAKEAESSKHKAVQLQEIFKSVSESRRIDFTDSLWGQVYIRQTPFKLDQDEQDRVIYGFNLGITTNIIE